MSLATFRHESAVRTGASIDALWLWLAAVVVLVPAFAYGRPFVFGDTAYYWSWGGDLIDALRRPWPHPGEPWIPGRSLHGWGGGLGDISRDDLRFDLTWLTARSAFYAIPFRLLVGAAGLWALAGAQALAAAWTLRTALRALAPEAPPAAVVGIAVALACLSSLGFEVGYAMPDLFGGLGLLAAALTMAAGDRLSRAERIGLIALMTYAVLAHAENGLGLAATVAIGLVASGAPAGRLRSLAPTAAAITLGLVIAAAGAFLLGQAFGQPLRPPPFPGARVLADGAAQAYLRRVCPGAGLAACDLASQPPAAAEHYLWIYPLEPPAANTTRAVLDQFDRLSMRHVTKAEADHRERFVAEQGALVLGALQADGAGEARRALAAGIAAAINVTIGADFDSARFLAEAGPSGLGATLAAITPGQRLCPRSPAQGCGRFDLGLVAPIERLALLVALGVLAIGAVRPALAPKAGLSRFAVVIVGACFANAAICGALSGPFARYQSRVEWLIPLCALLLVLQWRERGAQRSGKPSPVMIGPASESRR